MKRDWKVKAYRKQQKSKYEEKCTEKRLGLNKKSKGEM